MGNECSVNALILLANARVPIKSTVNRAINKYVAWSWVIKANLDTICQAHKIPKIPETTGIFIFRARFLQCQTNRPVLMEKIAISGADNRRTELSGFVTENTAEVAFRNKNKRNDN